MARRAPDIASVDGTIEANDDSRESPSEINRVNHAPAELLNDNVAVSRLGCLLRLNRIDSQRALTATAEILDRPFRIREASALRGRFGSNDRGTPIRVRMKGPFTRAFSHHCLHRSHV